LRKAAAAGPTRRTHQFRGHVIYRGFRSLTDAPDALLMAIIGGPDAGKVDWHPSVLEEARKTGLTVDEEGNLIIEKPAA
jgi:hypothetical protein